MRAGAELLEIGKARFLADLDSLLEVYAAAMRPPREQLPGRRAIMERHTQFPSFRAVVVTAPAAGDGLGTTPPARNGPGPPPGTGQAPVVAFSYGFHGADGQWWHDLVRSALTRMGGYDLAQRWLGDSFEVAEVHVHPDYQGRGIGRRMVPALLHRRLERTALLSTQDADSPAPPALPRARLRRPDHRLPVPRHRPAIRGHGRGAPAAARPGTPAAPRLTAWLRSARPSRW